jgi:UDP-GlcNAc:undecaprenyl-phosphate GlcNAc-1-phosphate transferase
MNDTWTIVLTGNGTFFLVALLVPVCRRVALKHGISDDPAPSKIHQSPTPYLGGVAIVVGAAAWSPMLPAWQEQAAAILAAAIVVALVGLVDDVRTVPPGLRLVVEVMGASVVVAAGAEVRLFGRPIDYVIAVGWIVVITNAFNLLDNMDAAVGSIAPVVATALAVAALLQGQRLVGGLAVVVAAACLAFLLYNWHPARIFMGDAGSLFLGFFLATISLKLRTAVPHGASAVALVLLVGPAVFDTTLVVISRIRAGRNIFVGGQDHTSHRLMLLGLGQGAVTAILVASTTVSATLGVLVSRGIVSARVAAPATMIPTAVAMVLLLRLSVYESGTSLLKMEERPNDG